MTERFSPKRVMLFLISAYQGLHRGPSPCRFWPSCSVYAAEAVEVHGAIRGGWMAFRRILRCHPFGPSGVDLVPLSVKEKRSR